MMKYKGYHAIVGFNDDDGVFFGKVAGIRDGVTFEGTTVDELGRAFRDSIDDYLAWCAERGEAPEKPHSGRLVVRISPDLHSRAAALAAGLGISLNKFIERAIKDEAARA